MRRAIGKRAAAVAGLRRVSFGLLFLLKLLDLTPLALDLALLILNLIVLLLRGHFLVL